MTKKAGKATYCEQIMNADANKQNSLQLKPFKNLYEYIRFAFLLN